MKVIKASIDLSTWSMEYTCTKCKSILAVESNDIRYCWANNGSCYYHTCCLCNARGYLGDVNIPEIVKADVTKHRADKSYTSDW